MISDKKIFFQCFSLYAYVNNVKLCKTAYHIDNVDMFQLN